MRIGAGRAQMLRADLLGRQARHAVAELQAVVEPVAGAAGECDEVPVVAAVAGVEVDCVAHLDCEFR